MTSGVEQHQQHRRLLVALVVAVLAVVVGVGVGVDAHASSSRGQVAGTRVAAHELLAGPVVAASEDVLAGEGRRTTTGAADLVVGSRVAPQTTLYRAVSKAELDDVAANGFRASERSMSGKFFAETPEHAAEWGRRLIYGKEGIPFHVVETRVPTSFADRLMRWDKLDGIGPARYVDDFLLDELNRLRSPIVDLPAIPRG